MPSRSSVKTPKKQQGLALLIMLIVIMLAFVSYSLSGLSIHEVKVDQIKNTSIALNKAKQALIAYAVTYGDLDGDDAGTAVDNPGVYGFLPCPDVSASAVPAEGGSHSVCGGTHVNAIGLFPWATLETGVLNSASGECLWYAVSGEYKDASSTLTQMLNEDTNGALLFRDSMGTAVSGENPEDRVVAVIINPSSVVSAQNRTFYGASTCGLDYSASEYLEGNGIYDNAALSGGALVVDDFINGGVGTDELITPFNDQIVTITRQELWGSVNKNLNIKMIRLTEALAWCMAEYGNNALNRRLPRPAPVDFIGEDYRTDASYDDTLLASYLGRYPYKVDVSDMELAANAPNAAESFLFNKGFCDSIELADGTTIDLSDVADEYWMLWKNWKDHFFYAVSEYYAPTNAADTGVPSCDGANCVQVNGDEYAAVVIYSGSRIAGQLRNEPISGDADTKKDIDNYLESINPIGNGTVNYTTTANDVSFCITDSNPLVVTLCP